jgi:Las17-binding protein actin regulator
VRRYKLTKGAEVTDFVMILNDAAAVRAFQQLGSVTLGGNLSLAAGPIGRNAEASGAANFKSIAPIFSYSKTKGLFAGVSLEGSVLIERRDANRKFYNAPVTAKQLLTGQFPAPPAADPLYRILNTRAFSGANAPEDSMYNDIPIYEDNDDDWDDDPQSTTSRNRPATVGRSNTTRGGESWTNNFSDEHDEYDDYDRQENRYKQQTYIRLQKRRLILGSLATTRIIQPHERIGRPLLRTGRNLPVQPLQNLCSLEKILLEEINTLHNSHLKANKVVISALRKETSLK